MTSPLPDGRVAFVCPHCATTLAVAAGKVLDGPCPGCGGLIAVNLAEPQPVIAPKFTVKEVAPYSIPQVATTPTAEPEDQPPAPVIGNRRGAGDVPKLAESTPVPISRSVVNPVKPLARESRSPRAMRRRARKDSPYAFGFLVTCLGLITGLGLLAWKVAGPIRQWVEEARIQRENPISPAARREAAGKVTESDDPRVQHSRQSWAALRSFLAASPAERAEITLEGKAAMGEPFARLFGKDGVLEDGLPDLATFRLSSDEDLVPMPGTWQIYRASRGNNQEVELVLAFRKSESGSWQVAGRLFREIAEARMAGFLAPDLDPQAELEFLARLRRRTGPDQAYAVDPSRPVFEILPPLGQEPTALLFLGENEGPNPLPDLPREGLLPITAKFGRIPGDARSLRLLEPPEPGWPGVPVVPESLAPLPLPPGGGETEAMAVVEQFLAATDDRRLLHTRGNESAMLMRELSAALGPPPPGGTALRAVEFLPRSADRAGATAVRILAPAIDGEGVVMAWLTPFAGEPKIDGPLFAQSYYGWFRSFIKAPSSSPRELRGVVTRSSAREDGSIPFQFRDVHSQAKVELVLPSGASQMAALKRLADGQARHATLRLRWESDPTPRIVLDEWVCWGYRGIDDQAY